MNFLAHLHIADHCHSQLLGNLLGDFVKGDPSKQYQVATEHGIRLHRFVDRTTDQHMLVEECKHFFTGKARRFAPIALDMFWDHCLAKHWQQYHPLPLEQFVDSAQARVEAEISTELPEKFLNLHAKMWSGGWLLSYRELENIEFALHRMSQRSHRMANLTTTFGVLEKQYNQLEERFAPLYRDVLLQAGNFQSSLLTKLPLSEQR
ncbi:ACP phosphodiesterase [Vibrio sp. CAU 1672]|uniref:acyl carrier protein phosphodiesterase n=1 Tax=Vibrio sp. CAU 1672 TaxID=3032594 RepID=UPI0023DA6F9E|nr:ACP phosphodiesterase [Vibrio sp. CAU 1672]MDF2154821.1 ACP phosphodiesterase [Vibrio sp. CAU 1672]